VYLFILQTSPAVDVRAAQIPLLGFLDIKRNDQFETYVSSHIEYAHFVVGIIYREIFETAHVVDIRCIQQIIDCDVNLANGMS
jgi:hypothetical protein